jgi:tRNA (mo5U34)-methyltransferase
MATLAQRVESLPKWYHRISLPGGVETPGWAPIDPDKYGVPPRLDGLRVLDVGAWDGYWTFEALKRGASQVIAVDNFSDWEEDSDTAGRPHWETFDLCRDAFGYDERQCQRHELDLYRLRASDWGTFDVIFFFGTFYHCRYPLLALDVLRDMCSGSIYVESAICDFYSPYRGGVNHGYPCRRASPGDKVPDAHMVMEFYPDRAYASNRTNWWAPTSWALGALVAAAGFQNVSVWRLTDVPTRLSQCRGFARGDVAKRSGEKE